MEIFIVNKNIIKHVIKLKQEIKKYYIELKFDIVIELGM